MVSVIMTHTLDGKLKIDALVLRKILNLIC